MLRAELYFGDKVVVTAENGPPLVEYALFSKADLSLRAIEIARVREVGYETTAGQALERLEQLGATAALAERVANLLRGRLGEHYGKGPAVQKHVEGLLTAQLLVSSTYDAEAKVYRGSYLDLETLSTDLGVTNVANAFQALALASMLMEMPKDVVVRINTEELTKEKPTGHRSHQRVTLPNLEELPDRLLELSKRGVGDRPFERELGGPDRSQLAARVAEDQAMLSSDAAREQLHSLEAKLRTRPVRTTGPLADPDLWAIETLLDDGRADSAIVDIDALEQRTGRTPALTYLRARAALALGAEDPRSVAERMTALSLSMSSFIELEVLAGEAWVKAREWRRALPFARDVLSNPHADETLRTRAAALAAQAESLAKDPPEGAVGTSPAVADSPPRAPGSSTAQPRISSAALARPSTPPRTHSSPSVGFVSAESAPPPRPRTSTELRRASQAPGPGADTASAPSPPPGGAEPISPIPSESPLALADLAARPLSEPPRQSPYPIQVAGHSAPQPMQGQPYARRVTPLSMPPPPQNPTPHPSERPTARASAPPPEMAIATPDAGVSEVDFGSLLGRRGAPPVPRFTQPGGLQAPAPSDAPVPFAISTATPNVTQSGPEAARSSPPSRPTSPPESQGSASAALRASVHPQESQLTHGFMRGASMPPMSRSEDTRHGGDRSPASGVRELAETLPFPVATDPREVDETSLPRSPAQARAIFTKLTRQLALDYREALGLALHTDLEGLEAMQAYLLETLPSGAVKTPGEAREVRRHGAFLSEMLARRLGAQWVDISSDELGHWRMRVPALSIGATRDDAALDGALDVWPFGRIIRFIRMRHRERDLVAYFLELQLAQRLDV